MDDGQVTVERHQDQRVDADVSSHVDWILIDLKAASVQQLENITWLFLKCFCSEWWMLSNRLLVLKWLQIHNGKAYYPSYNQYCPHIVTSFRKMQKRHFTEALKETYTSRVGKYGGTGNETDSFLRWEFRDVVLGRTRRGEDVTDEPNSKAFCQKNLCFVKFKLLVRHSVLAANGNRAPNKQVDRPRPHEVSWILTVALRYSARSWFLFQWILHDIRNDHKKLRRKLLWKLKYKSATSFWNTHFMQQVNIDLYASFCMIFYMFAFLKKVINFPCNYRRFYLSCRHFSCLDEGTDKRCNRGQK